MVEQENGNEDVLMRDVPNLPSETLEQTFAKISGKAFKKVQRSGRKRRRACRFPSSTLLPRPESAFIICPQTPKRRRTLDIALATPIKRFSTGCSSTSWISTPIFAIESPAEITLCSPEFQRTKIYSIFKPEKSKEITRGSIPSKSKKSGEADATAKDGSGRTGGSFNFSQLTMPSSYVRNLFGAGDGHDEDDEDPKKPITNGHEDSDVSSDNSEKRRRRRMIRKGKRVQGTRISSGDHSSSESQSLNPEVPEEIPDEHLAAIRISPESSPERSHDSRNDVDRWFLGVPSPFACNEIDDTTAANSISPSARSENLMTPSHNAFANDETSTDLSRSNTANLEMSKKESERPRRNSLVDTFLADGHPRVGTKFPNMAIEGFGRACGMPTTAQLHTLAGKRYTFLDDNGNRVLMNLLPIPTKISERSNLTPRDASFPGPSRKQLLADAESSRNDAKPLSVGGSEVACVTAAGGSPSRGRKRIGVQPSNAAREESEGRPGWRKTVLVPAHVITGENTRHTPWVADLRPLELERCGFTKESGYGPFLESSNGSVADYSTVTEDEFPLVHETETANVSVVGESTMTPRVEGPARTQQPADDTSSIALVDRTRSHGALSQISLDRGVSDTGSTQSRANPQPRARINGEIIELDVETRQDLGPNEPMIMYRTTGQSFEGPKVLHIERISDSEPSLPKQPSLTLPATTSREHWDSVPIRTDAPLVSEGRAPAISIGSRRNEDGQDQSASAPVHRSPRQSTSSAKSCQFCGCFLFEALRCIMCGLFQKQNTPSPDLLAPSVPDARSEPAIPFSLLSQTALSQAADSNGVMAHSPDGIEWRQVDWNIHGVGSNTVNATPESGTRTTSAATLIELAQFENPPSPRAKVSRNENDSGENNGRRDQPE